MIQIKRFTFNAFAENTYILWNEDRQCTLIDPGCNSSSEKAALAQFLQDNNLTPVQLLNTHCHIDHVLGNAFVHERYGLFPRYHLAEQQVLDACPVVADMYNVPYESGPSASEYIEEGESIHIAGLEFQTLWCPGHSPGSLVFYDGESLAIAGDVLFYESVGRTDLPGGNHSDLISSIRTKLFVLPDEVTIWPGHGPETTIAHERKHNPFVRE